MAFIKLENFLAKFSEVKPPPGKNPKKVERMLKKIKNKKRN